MTKPRLLIFASGTKNGGGSGFENLVLRAREDEVLHADIVGVVSNYKEGGVKTRANRLGIPFFHFERSASNPEQEYRTLTTLSEPHFVALSGWLLPVVGLDPKTTFNIHPGPLPNFGGKGMYGLHVHEAVCAAARRGEVTKTAVTMHFVTQEYDAGPVFFRHWIPIYRGDTALRLQRSVSHYEHDLQPKITNLVVSGAITWDGSNPASLQVPHGYTIDQGFVEAYPTLLGGPER